MSILKEPIIAYRAWRTMTPYFHQRLLCRPQNYDYNRLISVSMFHKYYDPRKILEAECCCKKRPAESSRVCRNRCGIYAFKNTDLVLDFLDDYYGLYGEGFVIGKIAMWGKVEEHEQGYRAQYAYPQSFIRKLSSFPTNLKPLANAWAVDIE